MKIRPKSWWNIRCAFSLRGEFERNAKETFFTQIEILTFSSGRITLKFVAESLRRKKIFSRLFFEEIKKRKEKTRDFFSDQSLPFYPSSLEPQQQASTKEGSAIDWSDCSILSNWTCTKGRTVRSWRDVDVVVGVLHTRLTPRAFSFRKRLSKAPSASFVHEDKQRVL